jgi:predicted nucleic acid-binding protein
MGLLKELAGKKVYLDTKLPEAIHAATAQFENCGVIVTNDRRFQAFPDIDKLYLEDFLEQDSKSTRS